MALRKGRKVRPPLTGETLNELALAYVGRFATTRAKLASYLGRKLRERGWSGDSAPDIDTVVRQLSTLGYVDDAAYALAKSRALVGRGYGVRRVCESLRAAGVEEEDSEPARDLAEAEAVEAALRFARRRRFGPFGERAADRAGRERALAAMVRAGHPFGLARSILALEPGSEVDIESLAEKA